MNACSQAKPRSMTQGTFPSSPEPWATPRRAMRGGDPSGTNPSAVAVEVIVAVAEQPARGAGVAGYAQMCPDAARSPALASANPVSDRRPHDSGRQGASNRASAAVPPNLACTKLCG